MTCFSSCQTRSRGMQTSNHAVVVVFEIEIVITGAIITIEVVQCTQCPFQTFTFLQHHTLKT